MDDEEYSDIMNYGNSYSITLPTQTLPVRTNPSVPAVGVPGSDGSGGLAAYLKDEGNNRMLGTIFTGASTIGGLIGLADYLNTSKLQRSLLKQQVRNNDMALKEHQSINEAFQAKSGYQSQQKKSNYL